jgi:ABC-type multidrug transport system fused ATPase/permease subunit
MTPPAAPPLPGRAAVRRLFGYLQPYRWAVAGAALCLLLGTPARLFSPLVTKYIVDEVIGKRRVEMLWPALLVMLAVHFVGAALQAGQGFLTGVVGQHFVFDLRNDVYRTVQAHSLRFFHDRRSGDLLARVMGDVDTLQDVCVDGVVNLVNNALQFITVAVILLVLSWQVGLATLAPMAGVALLVWLFNSKVRGLYRRIRDRLGDVSAKLQENLLGILVIKAFAREAEELVRFEAENRRYRDEAIKGIVARSVYFSSVFTVGFISSFVMVGVGAWYVLAGTFTLGGLIAYRGYWWSLFFPIQSLAQVNEMLQRGLAAAARLFEVLDEPKEIVDAPDAAELTRVDGALTFEQVTFGYRADEPVLTGVDLHVEPGGSLGVVGPSGAGKSTLLTLLLRLYDPLEGRILLDGHDLRQVTQRSLRHQCSIVTQEPFLFNASIRDNILYGRLEATEEELFAAAVAANAHDFVQQFADGYETVVGERGVKLSGGQKQRLCIARAFLADPRVLLLDEATAAVEPESEAIIQAALERLEQGRTAVIVSHRLSMVRDCDEIVVVLDGHLAEQGTHDELMAREGGWYARMYRLQMQGIDLAAD